MAAAAEIPTDHDDGVAPAQPAALGHAQTAVDGLRSAAEPALQTDPGELGRAWSAILEAAVALAADRVLEAAGGTPIVMTLAGFGAQSVGRLRTGPVCLHTELDARYDKLQDKAAAGRDQLVVLRTIVTDPRRKPVAMVVTRWSVRPSRSADAAEDTSVSAMAAGVPAGRVDVRR